MGTEHHDDRFEERPNAHGEIAEITMDDLQQRAAAEGIEGALGEAPEDSTKPTPWREAAVRIDTYRHAELGRSPTDGPVLDGSGLIGAIGPCPHDYLDALQWDHAAELLVPAVEPELEPPGLDLGP